MKKIFYFLFFLFWGASLWADVITLKNGQEIRGRLLKMTARGISIEVPGGKIWLKLEEVIKIQEESAEEYYFYQAQRLFDLEAFENALTYYRKSLSRYPHRAYRGILLSQASLGKRHFLQRDFPQAQHFFQEILSSAPLDLEARVYLASIQRVYFQWEGLQKEAREKEGQGHFRQSVSLLEKAQDLRPLKALEMVEPQARQYLQMARKAYEQKQYPKSAGLFKKALILQPGLVARYGRAYLNSQMFLVQALIRKKKYDEAFQILGDLQILYPLSRKILYFLGATYHSQGKLIQASELYCKVLQKKMPPEPINILKLQKEAEDAVLKDLIDSPEEKKKPFSVEGKKWDLLKSPYFLLYHRNQKVATRALAVLQYHYKRVRQFFLLGKGKGHFLPRARIYIHPTREAFLAKAPSAHQEGYSRVEAHFGKAVALELHTYQDAPLLFCQTLPHHLAHLIFSYLHPYGYMAPLWVREGLALLMEPPLFQRHREHRMALTLKGPGKVKFSSSWKAQKFPRELPPFLDFSHSLVLFLQEKFPRVKVLKFMENSSLKAEEALREALGLQNPLHLQTEWRWWARYYLKKRRVVLGKEELRIKN